MSTPLGNEIDQLRVALATKDEQIKALHKAAKVAHRCLTDWMVYYAPDQFETWRVKGAHIRIRECGGWLVHTENVLQFLKEATL